MPKSKEYLSTSDSEGSDEPKQKKKKVEKKVEKKPEKSPAKSSSSKPESKGKKGPGGDIMFPLSKMRYATVSEFRGKVMVGIREYYMTDDEQLRPGKKGISLTQEQWEALKDNIKDIDDAVNSL